MYRPWPNFLAACVLAATLPACVSAGPKPTATASRAPVVEIRHSEALKEKISPQQKLLLALKLGNLLDAEAMTALEKQVASRLAPYGASAVVVDLSHGEQPDLRALALEHQTPYVVTLFAGADVVLQGHGALSPNEMIANLFDAGSATPLWASLLRLSAADAQAPSSAVAGALASTLTEELTRIGVLATARVESAPEVAPSPLMVLKLRQTRTKVAPWPVALSLREAGAAVVFTLEGPAELSVSHMVLNSPERLVIDLAGVELARGSELAAATPIDDHPLVMRVRASQYRQGVVRVVLDLKRSVEAYVQPRTKTQAGSVVDSVSLRPI